MDLFDLIVGFLAGVGLIALGAMAWRSVSAWRAERETDEVDEEQVADETGEAVEGGDPGGIELALACAKALDDEEEVFTDSPEALELEPRFQAAVVRDSARGYRTGNLDGVLAGEFDLY